jgi:hypothetical protein
LRCGLVENILQSGIESANVVVSQSGVGGIKSSALSLDDAMPHFSIALHDYHAD